MLTTLTFIKPVVQSLSSNLYELVMVRLLTYSEKAGLINVHTIGMALVTTLTGQLTLTVSDNDNDLSPHPSEFSLQPNGFLRRKFLRESTKFLLTTKIRVVVTEFVTSI